MKSVLGFFSLLAVGFLAAGVLAVVSTSPGALSVSRLPIGLGSGEGSGELDLTSLLLGLAAGLLLATLARISWAELPRRSIDWLLANERNFARLAWAALFIGVLYFY
jgi:hypothetical protein